MYYHAAHDTIVCIQNGGGVRVARLKFFFFSVSTPNKIRNVRKIQKVGSFFFFYNERTKICRSFTNSRNRIKNEMHKRVGEYDD